MRVSVSLASVLGKDFEIPRIGGNVYGGDTRPDGEKGRGKKSNSKTFNPRSEKLGSSGFFFCRSLPLFFIVLTFVIGRFKAFRPQFSSRIFLLYYTTHTLFWRFPTSSPGRISARTYEYLPVF